MRTSRTPERDQGWGLAPLLVVGVTVGLLGPVLSAVGSAWAAVVGFVGLVLLLTVVVRRTRGTREESQSESREQVPGHV